MELVTRKTPETMSTNLARWPLVFPMILTIYAVAAAQDEDGADGCGDGCGESELSFGDDDSEVGTWEIEIDPTDPKPKPDVDPNRPPPIRVGDWEPPELSAELKTRLKELLRARSASPKTARARYDLAEFYTKHSWLPHAETELLGCVKLEPESVRPWKLLLEVYQHDAAVQGSTNDGVQIIQLGNGGIRIEMGGGNRRPGWLRAHEAQARILRAYREIIQRAPDQLSERRSFIDHLEGAQLHDQMIEQARFILSRLPADANLRFRMADVIRRKEKSAARIADRAPDYEEAIEVLRENLRSAPHHAPTYFRLSRIYAKTVGRKDSERVLDLERRGLFYLLVPHDLAQVTYREDALFMARDLAGMELCGELWKEAMIGNQQVDRSRRWLEIAFPRSLHSERVQTAQRLGRRGDAAAVGALIGYLWNLRDARRFDGAGWIDPDPQSMKEQRELEDAAISEAGRLGAALYPAAERFLRSADNNLRRERAVRMMSGLKDPRSVPALVDVLAHDIDKHRTLGVAACLENVGDPSAIAALVEAALDVSRPAARRREAALALAAFKDPRSVETLGRLAKDPDFGLETSYGLLRLTGDKRHMAKVRKTIEDGGAAGKRMLGLLEACDAPGLEALCMHAFRMSPQALRPDAMRVLRERFWKSSRKAVLAILLEESKEAGGQSELTIRYLGEIGGEQAVARLLNIVKASKDVRWEKSIRWLAETGDPQAEQYFRRLSILEKDSRRRRLAARFLDVTQERAAQRKKAAARG